MWNSQNAKWDSWNVERAGGIVGLDTPNETPRRCVLNLKQFGIFYDLYIGM